jgi:CRP/FNR family cyclic AMP-dependent transcriptional regulator
MDEDRGLRSGVVMAVDDVVEDLRRTALFAGVERGLLEPLASRAVLRRFARGQVVFTEGEPSDHLYVVRDGRLRVLVRSGRGDEMTLSVLGPGDALGELSMVDGRPRSASVEALDAAQLVTLPVADVRAALRADPTLLFAVAEQLAATVRRLTGETADLVFLDLPRRLAKLLLTEVAADDAGGAARVDPRMNQSGLAARLGVTRPSLNRALAGLVRHGWVSMDGGSYVLHDVAALRRFADS